MWKNSVAVRLMSKVLNCGVQTTMQLDLRKLGEYVGCLCRRWGHEPGLEGNEVEWVSMRAFSQLIILLRYMQQNVHILVIVW